MNLQTNRRTIEWFRDREYGFFFHFLNGEPGAEVASQMLSDEWNRYVDAFDVEALAEQLHRLRAGFAWITIGQNSGYYCAPNRAYDRYTECEGVRSHCSRRDLISDFADALAKYEIPLFVYSTCMAPREDKNAVKKLKCEQAWPKHKNTLEGAPEFERMDAFMSIWTEIHREWAERWQRKIHGWWIDGVYNPEWVYMFPDAPCGDSFAAALRAGNPDALVTFNPGVVYPPHRNYPGSPEDITAGEAPDPNLAVPFSPKTPDGLLYFLLTYAGSCWHGKDLRFTADEITEITRNVTDNGGVIAWDLPFTLNGISAAHFDILHDFTEKYSRSKEVFPKTALKVRPPVLHEDGQSEPGRLELEPESPEVTVHWNGNPLSAPYSLPYSGRKEQRLEVSRGGFRRGFPVYPEWRIALKKCFGTPLPITGEDGSKIASYSLALDGSILRIRAEIAEQEPLICSVPWDNSCLELFLATPDLFEKRQFCIQHNGQTVEGRLSGHLLPVDFVRPVLSRQNGILSIDLSVELPASYRTGRFRMEILQSVNRGGRAVRGLLFGSSSASPGTYALVESV